MKLFRVESPRAHWLRKARKLGSALLILLSAMAAYGQGGKLVPESPTLQSVTVNPSTGNTDITWSAPDSISTPIAGYVVYHYDILKKEGDPIDTIFDPSTLSYPADDGKLTSNFVESYVVAAFDTSHNISPLSNYLSTIFTQSKLDSCNKKIVISWNKYVPEPYKVTGYDIYTSVNGGGYTLSGHVPDTTVFELGDLVNGTTYNFYVRALLENGKFSYSNKTKSLTVTLQKLPQWINADYATVTESGEIALSFTIDPASGTELFMLERKTGQAGSYQEIAMIRTTVPSVTYTDMTADPESYNYYILSAINACNQKAVSSNVASNIVLENQIVNNEIILKWNSYYYWLGTVSTYKLFMDTGSGYNEYALINGPDTTYSVSIPEIMYSLKSGEACFYIMADEVSNPYGIAGESISNRACYSPGEIITVPNLFTPDGNLKNDTFKPVLTFSPANYHLVISDRQGRTVFETRDPDEAWDGTVGGSQLSEGVYMWFIKIRAASGKEISRTGTVTIFRNYK